MVDLAAPHISQARAPSKRPHAERDLELDFPTPRDIATGTKPARRRPPRPPLSLGSLRYTAAAFSHRWWRFRGSRALPSDRRDRGAGGSRASESVLAGRAGRARVATRHVAPRAVRQRATGA